MSTGLSIHADILISKKWHLVVAASIGHGDVMLGGFWQTSLSKPSKDHSKQWNQWLTTQKRQASAIHNYIKYWIISTTVISQDSTSLTTHNHCAWTHWPTAQPAVFSSRSLANHDQGAASRSLGSFRRTSRSCSKRPRCRCAGVCGRVSQQCAPRFRGSRGGFVSAGSGTFCWSKLSWWADWPWLIRIVIHELCWWHWLWVRLNILDR